MQCVDNYAHALEIRLHCYKTEEVCYKAVNTSPFTIQFVLKFYKTQEVCDRVIANKKSIKFTRFYCLFIVKMLYTV